MRVHPSHLLLAFTLTAAPALADYGSPPPPPPQPSASPAQSPSPTGSLTTSRQEAERYYSEGYGDVVKAGKEAEKGKQANAQKKYARALERCTKAVQLDSTYHEAWNLVGFTSRKLGDYTQSFAAYEVALRLKPDFALAHEYYGEGLVEQGNLVAAKQHLEALRKVGTPEQIAALDGSVRKYEAAHPVKGVAIGASTQADTSVTPVPADSATAGSGGK